MPRFRVPLEGGKETTLTVTEVRVREARISLGELHDGTLLALAKGGVDPKTLERPLGPVLAKKAEAVAAEAKLRDLNEQESAIVSDQQRLRENMKALRGSSAEKLLLQRYTRQLDEQETRLYALRQLLSATTLARDALLRELAALIANLSFEIES